MVVDMYRAILLQTEATWHKLVTLRAFVEAATKCSNWILSKRIPKESATDLQSRVLQEVKKQYGFNVQVVCSLTRALAKSKGDAVTGVTVKFNVPATARRSRQRDFLRESWGVPRAPGRHPPQEKPEP